jgi:predicted metal-dependent TIM-barrel fold hydrolase
MFSTSAAKDMKKNKKALTLDIKVVAVADGGLEQNTNAEGQLVRQLLLLDVLVQILSNLNSGN